MSSVCLSKVSYGTVRCVIVLNILVDYFMLNIKECSHLITTITFSTSLLKSISLYVFLYSKTLLQNERNVFSEASVVCMDTSVLTQT